MVLSVIRGKLLDIPSTNLRVRKNVKSRSLIKISKVNMSDLKVVMTVESEVEVKDIMKELHKIHSLMFPVNEIEDIGDKNIIYYIA